MGEPRPGGGGGGGRGMGMGSFSITHEGEALVVKRKFEFQGEERTFESRHTADDKDQKDDTKGRNIAKHSLPHALKADKPAAISGS